MQRPAPSSCRPSGRAWLLAIHHRTDLRIAAPSTAVSRLFSIVGADTILRIYPTVQTVLAA
ncbi:hypothetical protein ACFYY2_01265 [Streptomyces sp. NPDC001822]|uniref:hypothetical protein n=1 Tax=Streptomyces sp. NPDC001822 TaxID=3364614 RepID=UPI0036C9B52A